MSLKRALESKNTDEKEALNQPLAIRPFLEAAIGMTEALLTLHDRGYIYGAIKPSSFSYSSQENQISLSQSQGDFYEQGNATPDQNDPEDLPYIAPEWTGRTSDPIDFRSDLYSLGVTFFEFLTGRLPFESKDSLELIHCHLAKQPEEVRTLRPEIPDVVSKIISTLMAKNPKIRYQSAQGLRHDLSECLAKLDQSGTIDDFPLGQLDHASVFKLPEDLFGRETEIGELNDAFDRACEGDCVFLSVTGPSGIGKSSLIKEMRLPVLSKAGLFLSGKFSHLRLGEPYIAITHAFKEFANYVLSLDKERVEAWKAALGRALGRLGGLITEMVPELELLLGEQPPVIELPPEETQARFHLVLRKFVRALATAGHPLVLFLDDLQWADSASLVFLERILTDPEAGHLLIFGVSRDDEVDSEHPLSLLIERLRHQSVEINTLALRPLSVDAVIEILSEMFRCEQDVTRPLAEVILQKTVGNPFFLHTFLSSAYDGGFIRFSPDEGQWQWDLDQLRHIQSTENVVDLLLEKIRTLPETTQHMLMLASCVGGTFAGSELASLLDRSEEAVIKDLNVAIDSGMFVEVRTGSPADEQLDLSMSFRFTHDRIAQAANSMIEESEQRTNHLLIARFIENKKEKNKAERGIYELIDHYNRCHDLLTEQDERDRIAGLNITAGQFASKAAAHGSALNYFRMALELLGQDAWSRHYGQMLRLYTSAAASAYVQAEFDEARKYIEDGLLHAQTTLDMVPIIVIQNRVLTTMGRHSESIRRGLKVLRELGVSLPENPSKRHVLMSFARTKIALFGKKVGELKNLPETTDPRVYAVIHILASFSSSCYIIRPKLYAMTVFERLLLSLKYGNSFVSSHTYAVYGVVLCSVLGDIENGLKFTELAKSFLDEHDAREYQGKSLFNLYAFSEHWTQPIKETYEPLMNLTQKALEVGDLEYAAYASIFSVIHGFFAGQPLDVLIDHVRRVIDQNKKLKYQMVVWGSAFTYSLIQGLYSNDEKARQIPASENAEKFYNDLSSTTVEERTSMGFLAVYRLISSYVFNDLQGAKRAAEVAFQYLDSMGSAVTVPAFVFFDSLQLTVQFPQMNSKERHGALKKVNKHLLSYEKWAHYCPENYLHRKKLIVAEHARVTARINDAEIAYQEAAELARKGGFRLEEALCYECASRFFADRRIADVSEFYMRKALECYKQWGAWGKVAHIETQYPELEQTVRSLPDSSANSEAAAIKMGSRDLDLATVLKASQAISGEIVLDRLMSQIMDIVLENAGASRGCLLLPRDGKLVLVAERTVKDEQPKQRNTVVPEDLNLPLSVINYVYRTHKDVVLTGIKRQEGFWTDPYFGSSAAQSLLCTAIVTRSEVLGILYVENDQTEVGFGEERVDLLRILSGQAAISLQNAILYDQMRDLNEQLEQKVIERTAQLKAAQDALVDKAHKAGMADVASQVLHDVGNLLNSVSTSAHMINKTVKETNLTRLEKVDEVIDDVESIESFVQSDDRAPNLFKFFMKMSKVLRSEIDRLDRESARMLKGIQSIEDVLAVQQQYIQAPAIIEKISLEEIVEQALTLFSVGHAMEEVEIEKRFENVKSVMCERGKLVQAFLAMLENAYESLQLAKFSEKKITISLSESDGFCEIYILDNGMGIQEKHFQKLFSHGFTTKGKGRGFSLHAVANNIKEMGGKIWAENAEQGAVFKILFPFSLDEHVSK